MEEQIYQKFWQSNLEQLDEISGMVEKSIFRLEKRYTDFQTVYNELTERIDSLASIYSSINSILGREYLLRLKALMREYSKRYLDERINFNILHFLHAKMIELRDQSFEEFPVLSHRIEEQKRIEPDSKPLYQKKPYRWITFFRNGSWFITPYTSFNVVKSSQVQDIDFTEPFRLTIKIDNRDYPVVDHLAVPRAKKEIPQCFLFIRQKKVMKCYAVTKIGKKILARHDMISSKIKPYKNISIAKGYLKMFGKNLIYIQ